MTLSTTWINLKNIMLRLRAWSVNSSGPASVINLSSPNLQVRCLVSATGEGERSLGLQRGKKAIYRKMGKKCLVNIYQALQRQWDTQRI